jgi:hypothetical protein
VPGVLWPKCPMCWMLITGSVLTGGVMKLCVEMAGVVLFIFSFGKLLQFRRAALIVALTEFWKPSRVCGRLQRFIYRDASLRDDRTSRKKTSPALPLVWSRRIFSDTFCGSPP